MIEPDFPAKLARFALAVAERYPWLDAYTPVNEPLTTARFSGLYGHWYPHGRDDRTFVRALLGQLRAVVLAMQAVRTVNPRAQLIQTEDLGKTFSTTLLGYQADFDNERRWLTFDLLCGRVTAAHPLAAYLAQAGSTQAELDFFRNEPCPPDIIGINHYVTSERFLDENLEAYPQAAHGGNGRHRYADVEAVRVLAAGLADPQVLLQEAWQRYGLPLAVTEAHMGCTREEQIRWLWEMWQSALAARQAGVDIRAVTAWAVLGTYNWNSLVTRDEGVYEPGLFDLRAPQPRPTALARLVQTVTAGQDYAHPVLDIPGWWRREERLLFPSVVKQQAASVRACSTTRSLSSAPPRTLLITGATGTLGNAIAHACRQRGLPFRLLARQELDIAERASVERALSAMQPWAVINSAGYVRVGQAEREAERCFRENTLGPAVLARACAQRHIKLLTFSSDLVFDGTHTQPYVESDRVAPVNVYGRSKAAAEERVLDILPDALVIRTSAFFSPGDPHDFISKALRTLAAGRCFAARDDLVFSPTYVPDLVRAALNLLIDGECGIWHLANRGETSWAELARGMAAALGLDSDQVEARSPSDSGWPALLPRYSVLGSERGLLLPSLESALDRYAFEVRQNRQDYPAETQRCPALP